MIARECEVDLQENRMTSTSIVARPSPRHIPDAHRPVAPVAPHYKSSAKSAPPGSSLVSRAHKIFLCQSLENKRVVSSATFSSKVASVYTRDHDDTNMCMCLRACVHCTCVFVLACTACVCACQHGSLE